MYVAEAYNKYANRTIETIALQDLLNQEGRTKCKDLIEITEANYTPSTVTEENFTEVMMDPDGQIIEVMSSGPTVYRTTRPSSSGPGGKRARPHPDVSYKTQLKRETETQFLLLDVADLD